MNYVRSKMINGYGPYYYEVHGVRKGKKVEQQFVRYIGTSPDSKATRSSSEGPAENVVPNKPSERIGYSLTFDDGKLVEQTNLKTWDRQRRERAKAISRSTGSSAFQADALAKTAWRMGLDPEKVDWDQLQGKDLSYEDKLDKLEEMTGMSVTTDADREMEYANWQEDAAEREAFRVGVFGGEGI
jgi:hypothetical protein